MFIDFSNPGPDCGSGEEDDRPDILTDVHYLHFALISAAVSLTVLVCVSIVTKPRTDKQVCMSMPQRPKMSGGEAKEIGKKTKILK